MSDAVQGWVSRRRSVQRPAGEGFDLNGQAGNRCSTSIRQTRPGCAGYRPLPDELALSGDPNEPGNGDNLNALIELKNQKTNIPARQYEPE
jgi:flagellar hook-associated protein 1 FlgK